MKAIAQVLIIAGIILNLLLLAVRQKGYKEKPQAVEQPKGWIQAIPYAFLFVILIFITLSIAANVGVIPIGGQTEVAYRTIGIVLYYMAIGFVVWSAKSLGKMLRPEVMIQTEHQLVTSGAFQVVRHPIYFSAILSWLGIGLALSNILLLVITFVAVIPIYIYRAKVEEQLLIKHFGQAYEEYQQQVPMIFPFLKP